LAFGTYHWAHVRPLSRYGVVVPVLDELLAVMLYILEEEGMKEPDVVGILPIKAMKPFKAGKEGPPATGEVAANLKPHPLDPGIICRAVCIRLPFNLQKCLWGVTYVPHMNEARFGPRYIIIHVHRSTFSDPLSPLTR
jgi:hypothetical protein